MAGFFHIPVLGGESGFGDFGADSLSGEGARCGLSRALRDLRAFSCCMWFERVAKETREVRR